MTDQKKPENGLLIPKNTFTEQEWQEIEHYAASINVTPGELLAEAWRDWCLMNEADEVFSQISPALSVESK